MTRIRTQLRLMGTIAPEHITQQLKMQPDESWKPGDSIEHTQLRHENHGWVLCSGWEDAPALEIQAQQVLDRLNYRIGALPLWAANNRQTLDIELACCIELDGPVPSINFSSILLDKAASLGMSIDVDVILVAHPIV